ncbi:hypothetical protein CONLIGDRAFT_472969 [Coniochaeta ligniaria NRRL 30616]|uniref:Uncharacterized protein n=1 Tax=Coniochaeta ligniaria NRRL 30616 TaxID=1408157 RepID=A0A1J7IFH8_9PEZI|nr:hypothetical protein CONLIGDRAFT_472969 [Coniochaeta ligniaria NRRL 30616]
MPTRKEGKKTILAYLADHFSERSGSRETIILFLDGSAAVQHWNFWKRQVLPAFLHLPGTALCLGFVATAHHAARTFVSRGRLPGPCPDRPASFPEFLGLSVSVDGGGVSLFWIMVQLNPMWQCKILVDAVRQSRPCVHVIVVSVPGNHGTSLKR